MKPLRLTARGYRSFADLDYRFVDGATAVVGSNGAGKSTLIGAVEIALFGPRSRSLEPLVREGSDDMQITLEFEHGGDVYRVRRSWKKGKSALDLERWKSLPEHSGDDSGPCWEPLTQGNAADTQALIEQTIGLSRSTFLASGYLAQRQSDSFTGAQPKDRKKILSDALALDSWGVSESAVGVDRRVGEKQLAEITAKVEGLAERAAQVGPLTSERDTLTEAVQVAVTGETAARAEAEQHAVRAADLDAAATAWRIETANTVAARAANSAHLEKAAAAQVARERLDGQRQELGRLERLDVERSELTAKHGELTATDAARTEALLARQALEESIARYTTDLAERATISAAQESERRRLAEARTAIASGAVNHCDRCAQALPDTARAAALESLDAQIAAHEQLQAKHLADAEPVEQLKTEATFALATITVPDPVEGLADTDARLTELAQVPVALATVRERIAGLEQTIAATDTDEYRDEARRLSYELTEAEQTLAAIAQPEPGATDHARAAALQAKAAAESFASRARTASERLAAVTALLEQAQAAAAEHTALVAELDRLHAELDILTRLEQAFGKDGIPAWIVESRAIPVIEMEANKALARLGGVISRVELRTERETKAGDRREALDVICFSTEGERALETFSGGEQTRAEMALALGLVELLQGSQDADLRFLALDEPAGLDAQGTEALAEILCERATNGSVILLASHDPGLRDAFDQSITVERGPGGSRVTA